MSNAVHTPTPEARSEPEVRIEEITPEKAELWITYNGHNRPLREARIAWLSGALERGEWRLNGDAIRFSTEGLLLDGQHRLYAIALTGSTVHSNVARGLAPEAQETMDMGAKRTLGDILKLRGEVNTNDLAAALNLISIWRYGEHGLRNRTKYRLSAAQAIELLEAEPGIRESVRQGKRLTTALSGAVHGSVLTACWHLFSDLDGEDCEVFWRQVTGGENLKATDPTYRLRHFLMKNRYSTSKVPQLVTHAVIVKAWNAFREGKEIELLSFKMGGARPERFPVPV